MRKGFRKLREQLRPSKPKSTDIPTPTRSFLGASEISAIASSQIGSGSTWSYTSGAQRSAAASHQTPITTTIGHGAKNVLEVATEAADAFAPLKSVLGGIRAALKVYEVRQCIICD